MMNALGAYPKTAGESRTVPVLLGGLRKMGTVPGGFRKGTYYIASPTR